jgi:hypothetical protein
VTALISLVLNHWWLSTKSIEMKKTGFTSCLFRSWVFWSLIFTKPKYRGIDE